MEDELVVLDGALQLGGDLVAADCLFVHFWGEPLGPCLAVALRHVHGQIGVAQEAAGVVDAGVSRGYADADVDGDVSLPKRKVLVNVLPLGDGFGGTGKSPS